MSKLRRIFESTPEISFLSPQTKFSLYWKAFLNSELSKIYQSIPWTELCKSLKIKDRKIGRIVSIAKSYIRPIVRGKEVKKVEFGAKVNMIQADGINFIEHISFNAFNEGVRLIDLIRYSRTLLGKVTHISADDIYATNVNRKYCKRQGIVIKRKGRAGKHEDQRMIIARELRKERATHMEGNFGTEKQHYSLD